MGENTQVCKYEKIPGNFFRHLRLSGVAKFQTLVLNMLMAYITLHTHSFVITVYCSVCTMQCQTQQPHLIVIPYDPARIVLHAANILYSSGLKNLTHIATLHYLSDTIITISDGFNQGPRRAALLRGRSPSIERKFGIKRKFCKAGDDIL